MGIRVLGTGIRPAFGAVIAAAKSAEQNACDDEVRQQQSCRERGGACVVSKQQSRVRTGGPAGNMGRRRWAKMGESSRPGRAV